MSESCLAEPEAGLTGLLKRAAFQHGGKIFALDGATGKKLSFAALRDQALCFAAALRTRLNIQPHRHVALLLPNCLEFLPAYFGILQAGCVAVPINARLKAEELRYILEHSEADAILIHPATQSAAQQALQALNWNRPVVAVSFQKTPPGALAFESLTKESSQVAQTSPPSQGAEKADATAAIIYTSGTTGRPKGAMLTHGNILFNVQSTKAGHSLLPADVHLLVVPLFHVTGLNTIMPTALEQGAQLVISSAIDPEELIELVSRHACTTFFGVPTTFYLLANLPELAENSPRRPELLGRLKSLRLICYSGAPMSALTIQRLRALFKRAELHNFYGLTESTSVSTVLPDEQALARSESVGLPPPGLELCVQDEQDRPLKSGETGELCIRGPSIFKGYLKQPQATAEAFRGGWFHTGDTALIDAEGYVFLRGRKKEMAIVAGENVYPLEVENALCAHPAVQEAAAFGRPDAVLGEVIHAAVVLRPGQKLTERELKQFIKDRLAAFKQPRTIRFLDKLPRNPSGKVLKRDL